MTIGADCSTGTRKGMGGNRLRSAHRYELRTIRNVGRNEPISREIGQNRRESR